MNKKREIEPQISKEEKELDTVEEFEKECPFARQDSYRRFGNNCDCIKRPIEDTLSKPLVTGTTKSLNQSIEEKQQKQERHAIYECWGVDGIIPRPCISNTDQKQEEHEDLERCGVVDIPIPSACTSSTEQKNVEAAPCTSSTEQKNVEAAGSPIIADDHSCDENCNFSLCIDALIKSLLEDKEGKLLPSKKYDNDHLNRKRGIFRWQNTSYNVSGHISDQCQETGCITVKDSKNCALKSSKINCQTKCKYDENEIDIFQESSFNSQIPLNPNNNQSLTIAKDSKRNRNTKILDVVSLDGYRGMDPIDLLVKYIETPSDSKNVENKGNSKKKTLNKKENGVKKDVLDTKENYNKNKYVKKQQSNAKDIKEKVNIERDIKDKEIDFDKNIICKDKLLNNKTEKEMDANVHETGEIALKKDNKKKGKKQRANTDKPKSNSIRRKY
ncbi:uncharacterized protein LOC119669498 isoform X2 [Teleopsis dalmanni]|uniref:uncharacterized protein LOC119669498 isoform X2 n=1 Tax=Teleopsis dalmanni TaxID=139649 RepID=UPI0018CD5253|nr:uncharacterized protein LOC119669498 isoform X2 [Teleopsis dalmanni]